MQRGPFFHIFSGLPRNVSFRRRLFISFLTIAIPILAAMAIVSYALTSISTMQTLIQAQDTQISHLNARLSQVYSNVEAVSRDIILSADIQTYLQDATKENSYPDDSAVSYTVSALMSGRDYIDSVVITGRSYTLYSTANAYTDKASIQNIRSKWWYRHMVSQKRSYAWYPYATMTSQTMEAQQNGEIPTQINTMMLARPIYSINDPAKLLGYLMIYVNNDYMHNLWRNTDWGNTTNLFLLDGEGAVIDSNNALRDYSRVMTSLGTADSNRLVRHEGTSYIYSCTELGINGWKTCMITPYRELNRSISNVVIILVILFVSLILLIFWMSTISSNNMSRPVAVLSKVMDAYHGSDSVQMDPSDENARLRKVYESRTDEIGDIYRSYAQLQDRIQNLIREIYVKNLEKKDAELALLQSQINPHFLYNTLDSINWLALMHDEEEISSMITALSDTFRLSLMKNNSYFVALSTETEYVRSYLILQKFRYGDRLTYEMSVPDALMGAYIPRFILQPLVENALKHGIDTMPGGGKISIMVSTDAAPSPPALAGPVNGGSNDDPSSDHTCLYIDVINDGVSIDLAKMKEILSYHPEDSELLAFQAEGYGVQNIYRRIKVICGDAYGLSYSVRRNRTICRVTLPVKTSDEPSA